MRLSFPTATIGMKFSRNAYGHFKSVSANLKHFLPGTAVNPFFLSPLLILVTKLPPQPNPLQERKVMQIGLYIMYGHTYSKSMDQPGKVANPARGQLNRKSSYSPVRVRA